MAARAITSPRTTSPTSRTSDDVVVMTGATAGMGGTPW